MPAGSRVMDSLARALVANEGADLTIESTPTSASRSGSRFVIVVDRGRWHASWEDDIEIPGRHGIFMHIADSIGPGGICARSATCP